MWGMKKAPKKALILTAMLATAPMGVVAQETPDAGDPLSRGAEMMREGMGLILRGLRDQMQPMTDDLAQGWARLIELLGDFSAYELPEVLPNGDIIIRRKVPLDTAPDAPEAPEGQETPQGPDAPAPDTPDSEGGEIDL